MTSTQKQEWEKVYSEIKYTYLPWYGLKIPKPLKQFIKKIPKTEPIIATGCGLGDSLQYIHKKGFNNILGTDISSNAIKIAKSRFPKLNFKAISTENLPKWYKNKANIADIYVLHHITPRNLKKYISALESISKKLLICYFTNQKKYSSVKSNVKKRQKLYMYNSRFITSLFKKMKLDKQEMHDIKINLKTGKKLKFKVAAQTYTKSF